MFARFIRDDQGQDLIEYLLLGSFVSIGALLGATLLGTELNGWYSRYGFVGEFARRLTVGGGS